MPTGSGATGVQLVEWAGGRLVVREHLGSAHTPGELAALIEVAKQRIQGDQQAFDLELGERGAAVIDVPAATAARIQQSTARILWQGLTGTYARLGFDVVGDQVFRDLVLCRVVEPTSKLDSVRVLAIVPRGVVGFGSASGQAQ
ncbi:hypothetical protein [Dietzia natronolimnaea]|uniref:hypothetical protein n=1 Tax=Dietzia natronolimnaea TaxID=161920 RepID=UPI001FEC15B9|nr:hypothetical protein [Dietzia natronolimnaea]